MGALLFQSLNRDGVHSRIHLLKDGDVPKACFNPSIGMVFIRAKLVKDYGGEINSFNPSIGMVFIRAGLFAVSEDAQRVSIPQSGWCSFALFSANREGELTLVSIPQSGWCSFALG